MPELISMSTGAKSGIARDVDEIKSQTEWGIGELMNIGFTLPSYESVTLFNTVIRIDHGITLIKDVVSSIVYDEFDVVDTSVVDDILLITGNDTEWSIVNLNDLDEVNGSQTVDYTGVLPHVDLIWNGHHRKVDVLFDKPTPPADVRYIPTTDFIMGSELIGFTPNFINPIDFDKLKTVLSPVDNDTDLPWSGLGELVSLDKSINYGYSINAFVISGGTNANYPVDEDALVEPPIDPPEVGEVIRIVNVVNVVVLPSRTPIEFTNLTLSIDLNSVAWTANFDIADLTSLALIKPSGATRKEVEININGDLFNVFIGKTSTSLSGSREKGTTRAIKCVGWSKTKELSHPYHNKRSHTELSSSTPSGLLNGELTGTGFTGTWNSVSWTIPANVFSYLEKAPLAAISELAKSVGAVIVPHQENDSFTVEPYYPISPWNWSTSPVDYTLSEAAFFTIDTEWLPQESPDSIYVYGEEIGGVAVKCVKQGTAGLVTLPTVVDKYITDTIAGTERGRIEVAKNGFKEIVPVTTYIDGNGIIKPQSLLEVNAIGGGTWFGMVIGTSISIKRNGNAVIQALQIERHYD